MAHAENRGDYWRGRYRLPDGRLASVCGPTGEAIRFGKKRDAARAATEEEVKARGRAWRDPKLGRMSFCDYANRWYDVKP